MPDLISSIIKTATFLDEAYAEAREGEFDLIVLTKEEILRNMNIDELTICYGTSRIQNYTIRKAQLILLSDQIKSFQVSEIIVKHQCIYLKIKHSIPYDSGLFDFGSVLAINYVEPNENVIVYGYPTRHQNERVAFSNIANEIIAELSKSFT